MAQKEKENQQTLDRETWNRLQQVVPSIIIPIVGTAFNYTLQFPARETPGGMAWLMDKINYICRRYNAYCKPKLMRNGQICFFYPTL